VGSSLDPSGFPKCGVSAITNLDVSRIEEECSVSWVIDSKHILPLPFWDIPVVPHPLKPQSLIEFLNIFYTKSS
jgi:hypothetical protein